MIVAHFIYFMILSPSTHYMTLQGLAICLKSTCIESWCVWHPIFIPSNSFTFARKRLISITRQTPTKRKLVHFNPFVATCPLHLMARKNNNLWLLILGFWLPIHSRFNSQHLLFISSFLLGGRPVWTLNECKNLHFGSRKNIYMNSKNYETNGCRSKFGFAKHLALIMCFIFNEKWMEREKYPYKTCFLI